MIEIKKNLDKVTFITGTDYSVDFVRSHPKSLFVFGDNVARLGKGGQACIRYEPNSIGIPTKRFPSMKVNSFFLDTDSEARDIISKAIVRIYRAFTDNKYDCIVFNHNALGTGLAQMPIKCPITFLHLNNLLKLSFNIDIYKKNNRYYYTKTSTS